MDTKKFNSQLLLYLVARLLITIPFSYCLFKYVDAENSGIGLFIYYVVTIFILDMSFMQETFTYTHIHLIILLVCVIPIGLCALFMTSHPILGIFYAIASIVELVCLMNTRCCKKSSNNKDS